MIKAVIFDCFGVLVTGSLEKFIDTYIQDEAVLEEVHSLNDQANTGLISYEQMIKSYAELAEISAEQALIVMDDNPKNKLLVEYIKSELKGKYRIGFLSNAADNWVEELLGAEDAELFDEVVLSCDVKLVKPDPRIYEIAATRLRVELGECIFVDDIERYCVGATDAGMKAVHYRSFKQAKAEIETLLEVSDTNK